MPATPDYTQDERLIAVDTPLGKDELLLTAFSGREEMSRLFCYTLQMASANVSIEAKDIVGKQVGFRIAQEEGDTYRYFNGFVSRFSAGAADYLSVETPLRRYRAEVVPWLWFLTLNANCRIFQDKSIPEIIEQIFKDRGFTDHKKAVKGQHPKLEYCVQYRETDFEFVSRLMERAGIFYFFEHEEKKHTLVWADDASGYISCPEGDVEYHGQFGAQLWGRVEKWEHQFELTPGKFSQTDYNFETPSTKLLTKENTVVKLPDAKKHEIFEYPGQYAKAPDGKALAKVRIEELEVPHDVVAGTSSCVTFTPGAKFKLKEHPVESEKNKSYVIISVEHEARAPSGYGFMPSEGEEEGDQYSNSFQCIPDKTVFRPARTTPRPMVHGPQTAKVVGPKGEEIHTDKYGRIKVQFHWDREGKFDDKSSCWMRVAQRWAGQEWGMLYTPRVGQEVMVEFLDGDPDRPLVTGGVYNAEQMPPYKLPDKAKQSGIKTRSTDKGDKTKYNELRFDDTKDKEHVYFHAQKDFARVVENVDVLEVGYDKLQSALPLEGDKGDQKIEILNNRTVTVHEGDAKLEVKQKDHIVDVDKGNQLITIAKGDQTVKVKGNQTVKVEGNQKIEVTGDQKIKSKTTTIEALQKIVLKVGGNSVTIDSLGVKVKGTKVNVIGTMVDVKADAKAALSSPLTDVKGDGMLKLKGGMVMIN